MKKENVIWLSQKAYSLCIMAMGIKQLIYGRFDGNFLPSEWSTNIIYKLLAYPWGIAFTLAGLAFFLNKKAYEVALISGGIFLGLMILAHFPFVLFSENRYDLLSWSAVVQSSSFAGSSFILAASLRKDTNHQIKIIQWLEQLVPYGRIFFSIMLITYGADHFLYPDLVSTMVPSWIPFHYFWTYFAGLALIGAGLAIILKIKLKLVATLVGIMLFTWCLIIHIPNALADPSLTNGLEVNRAIVTFGFTGVALLIALTQDKH